MDHRRDRWAPVRSPLWRWGVTSASAQQAKYTCTKSIRHHKVTVMVRKDRAEDAVEARGWTRTGDTY